MTEYNHDAKEGHSVNVSELVRRAASELDATGARQWDWPLARPSWSDDVCQSYEAYKRDVSARAAREVDVAAIMRYFDTQELTARVFEELIAENGLTIETERSTMANPLLAVFCRLIATGIKLANEIGATPMSRVKLGLYAIEGATAQAALERQINNHSDVPVTVEIDSEEIAVRW